MSLATIERIKAKFSDAKLKVDSNAMITKAGEVSEAIRKMQNAFDDIENIVRKTSAYWEGAAADYYRQMYNDKKDQVQEVLNRLKEHPEELELMANNYVAVEKRNEDSNAKLRNDYI